MLTTILVFQTFFTATGDGIGMVLIGAWFILHPTERRRLRLLWQTQAPSLDQYQRGLLRNDPLLAALHELFLWVNWWFTFPVGIFSWLEQHRSSPFSWFASRFLSVLPIIVGLPLAVCVSLAFVTRDRATLAAAGTLAACATIRLLALISASKRR